MKIGFQTTILSVLSNVLLCHRTGRGAFTHRVLHQWMIPEFSFPSEEAKYRAMIEGELIPINVAINDVDYHAPSNRYFVTAPLFRDGIPATLSEILPSHDQQRGILKPFPSWPNDSDNEYACSGPFSVYRISIDKCGFMWVIDSGRSDIIESGTLTCRPKLLVYDLNNGDHLLLHYVLPMDVFTDRSYLVNIITESYRSDCADSIAYVADANDHGLIVFDYATLNSWRIENRFFHPSPAEVDVYTNGVVFSTLNGVYGLALGPLFESGVSSHTDESLDSVDSGVEFDRELYFHSLASVRESWVAVSVLKNKTIARDPRIAHEAFVLSPGQRAGQSTVQVMTDEGILIYALIPQNALACWNSRTPFTTENQHILESDDEDFQYISSLKLKNDKLFILSSRLQNYLLGMANNSDIKYRVMVIDNVNLWLQSSPCSSEISDNVSRDDQNVIAPNDEIWTHLKPYNAEANNDRLYDSATSYDVIARDDNLREGSHEGHSSGNIYNNPSIGYGADRSYTNFNFPLPYDWSWYDAVR